MTTSTYLLHSAFTDQLLAFAESASVGDRLALDSVGHGEGTTESWDEVTLFGDGTDQAEINRAVGAMLFDEPDGRIWVPSALLVFRSAGEVTEAVVVPPPLTVLGVHGHWYSRRTSVIASDVGRPPWLVLADPDSGR